MYIHEAIKKAQEENLCIKRECWDSARIEFEDCISGAKECEPCIDGERWMPMAWELTADDWLTCSYTEEPCTLKEQEPEPGRKKYDIDMSVIRRKMNIFALVSASIIFLAAVISMVIKLTS